MKITDELLEQMTEQERYAFAATTRLPSWLIDEAKAAEDRLLADMERNNRLIEEERAEKRHMDGRGRRYKYKSGDRLVDAAGKQFGHLTVIGPVQIVSDFFPKLISTGRYLVQCDCGSHPFELHIAVISTAIKRRQQVAYSCGRCEVLGRKIASRGRGPAKQYQDRQFGRLHTVLWIPGRGWECICEDCEGTVIVPWSSKLEWMGKQACSGVCGQ